MIYLDYSANTPVDEAVLERFCAVERSCPGNANSRHQAGAAAKAAIDEATQSIARSLNVQPAEIIYTSGASEANNFALKSIARLERHHGKHIISTPLEHSSVSGSLTALQEQGYEIDLVDIKQDGTVDLAHLRELLRPDTILVAVTAVDSELGVVQPVTEIAALLKDYPHCHLHVDATQAVGKIPVSFEGVDTMSLTAHKFYGLNGIGLLIGGFMIPFFALSVLGKTAGGDGLSVIDGMRFLIENHSDMLNSIAPADSLPPAVPWPTVFTGLFFLGLQSWCTHQSFIQRVLAAKNLKEAQKGALYCAFLKILGFMFLALPGVIAYAIFNIEGTQVSMMDDAYPALITRVVPQPVMGFFAAVMFGAILSSFNSVLNSVNTMFTMDIYKEFINKNASDKKLVSVGKNIGIVFAIFSMIVGPMVYFFPAGLKTFLDSFVMLVGLPVLSGVFGGFFFNCLPKYSARFIMVFHIICYGGFMLLSPSYSLFGGNEGSIHYLYAVSILWPLEMLIMYLMHRRNKSKGAEVWVQQDVGAVDLTPWKYSKLVSVIVIVCVLLVYLAFSPLGIGA